MEQEREKHWKMPADLKRQWIGALTSGEFKQSTSTLVDIEHDEIDPSKVIRHSGYCCLGVLGHLCGLTDDQMTGHDLLSELRPEYQNNIPDVLTVKYNGESNTAPAVLAKLNDGFTANEMSTMPFDLVFSRLPEKTGQIQYDFDEIAQFIEDNIEGVEEEFFGKDEVKALNEHLNAVLTKREEEIVILKKQLDYEKSQKEKHFQSLISHKRYAKGAQAKLWDITQALNASVGWFNKSKRRLTIIELILTRKEE